MRRILLLPLLPLLSLACSQAPISTTSAGEAASTSPLPVYLAASTPAATTTAVAPATSEDRDFSIPREKFTDPQRNFDAAKKALLEGYYDPSITEEDLYRAAVAGMLERVDGRMHAWNRLLSPTEVGELRSDLQGEIVGIGVKIDIDPATGYIDVKGTIPGSPADRAGIAPPDKIVTVGGKLYKGLGLHDVVSDIRGKAGDTVTLSVLRGDKLVSIPVVRQKVTFDLVRGSVVGDGVGLVEIPSFNSKTPGALHDVLTELSGKGVGALVVDLRGNPGGSFDDAVAAAGEMVPAGSTVVVVQKRGNKESVVPKTTPVGREVPIAVLVDHDTASSAELLTAALQELRHATVIGSRTKGKWTVQTIDDLANGYAIKYTLGIFSSPAGRTFDGTGLAPDVEVDQTDELRDRAKMDQDPVKRLADDVRLRTALAVVAHAH
jgi:carboxyl-terminal processing protease